MLIDWFTVGAQALNFLILVWLMKRFLYKPILHAIDAREKRIASELANADAKRVEAQRERDEFQRKNEEFDRQHAALLSNATDEVKAERQRLLDEARKDVDLFRSKRRDALQSEQRDLNQKIVHWTQKEVFAIARKTLAYLASTSLEERIGEVFVGRLCALTGTAKEQLATALKSSTCPVRVRSAFGLPPAQQSTIEKAIKESFSAEPVVQFEITPDLVSGIELSANGQKVSWSIAEYLATLERSAGELLQEDARPESTPGAKLKPETESGLKAPKAVAKSEPKAEGSAAPMREPKNRLESELLAPKADH